MLPSVALVSSRCPGFSLQYLMIQQTPFVRRQVRKLLLFICGSKDKYRQLRDLHTLDSHVRGIKKLLEEQGIFLRASVVTASSGSALQYDTLISLVREGALGWPWGARNADVLFDPIPLCPQMEHLKACAEIATQRTVNWQKFCIKDDCEFCLWQGLGNSGVVVGIKVAQMGKLSREGETQLRVLIGLNCFQY